MNQNPSKNCKSGLY